MLWEALAGRHPFWRGSMLETARAIEAGARPLGELRPDLPKRLLRLVDRSLSQNPGPAAVRARARRRAARRGRFDSRPAAAASSCPSPHRARAGASDGRPRGASLAGWTSAALPFYPARLAASRSALVAAAATLLRERVGHRASRSPCRCFPLGNISLGLALLYTALAAGCCS